MDAFRTLTVMFACAMAFPMGKLFVAYCTNLEEGLKNNPRRLNLLENRVAKLEEEMKKK